MIFHFLSYIFVFVVLIDHFAFIFLNVFLTNVILIKVYFYFFQSMLFFRIVFGPIIFIEIVYGQKDIFMFP